MSAQMQLAGAQNDKMDFYTKRCDGLDCCPSPAGAGEGGRRPGEGCREQTNFPALGDVLYLPCRSHAQAGTLTPAEIKIVEGAAKTI